MVQTKLEVGAPNDTFEREADRVADQVMGMAGPPHLHSMTGVGGPGAHAGSVVHRQPVEDVVEVEDEGDAGVGILRAKSVDRLKPRATADIEKQWTAMRGRGQRLPLAARDFFEPRFQHDFGQVRVHTGTEADEATRALNAYAFTVGPEIVFRDGHYAPERPAGQRLLAHELSHTIQQGASSPITDSGPRARRETFGAPVPNSSGLAARLATGRSMLQKADCNFFVYDSTESGALGAAWSAGARARAMGSWGGYAIASGGAITTMLKRVLAKYDAEDCDCTEEIQFWSHGSAGNAMSIKATGDELTAASFDIPDLDKYGHLTLWDISLGVSNIARDAQRWYAGLTEQQRLLHSLRETICGQGAEVYYRSCSAFQGARGQRFAKASTRFWRSKVIGHTKVIALTQPGKKVLKPGQEPYWLESEGAGETEYKKDIYGDPKTWKPKKD